MGETASSRSTGRAIVEALDRLAGLVDESSAGPTVPRAVRERARARALELDAACGSSEGAGAVAALSFAADVLSVIAVDLAAHPREARRLIEQIETIAGVPRVALGRELLRPGRLPEMATDVAIEVELALLLAFTGAEVVSLWTRSHDGELTAVSHAGEFERQGQNARLAADALLENGAGGDARDTEIAVRIDRADAPAVLVAIGPGLPGDHRALLLEAAAPELGGLLDRDPSAADASRAAQPAMTAVERRLARLRFDLHDGPQQDVHLLAQDLGLFREQLRSVIAGHPNADRLLGRLDDLDAQLVALDGDLRRLSTSVQSPFMQPGSLPEVLGQMTESFAGRTGVEPQTRLSGDLEELSDSQQITLLALIREALSNIGKHSDARSVTITIASDPKGVEASVSDDGRGFDPETTLVDAARAGRLGLVGMHERVRMLGGRTQIDSRPGGPTLISVSLPRWHDGEP